MNAFSFQFIVQITLFQLQFLIKDRKFPITVGLTITLLNQKLKMNTSILMFGNRNLDYKMKIKTIQFYIF